MTRRVLIVCGTGVATSTVVADRVRRHLEACGIDAKVEQSTVAELHRGAAGYDLIVATTQVRDDVGVPVVAGLPFLTGVGADEALAEIEGHLRDSAD